MKLEFKIKSKRLKEIEMKVSEALVLLQSSSEQAVKAHMEIVTKIDSLQAKVDNLTAELADVVLTEVQAQAVLSVVEAVQGLDDINPDPVVVEVVEQPPIVVDPSTLTVVVDTADLSATTV